MFQRGEHADLPSGLVFVAQAFMAVGMISILE